MSGLPVRLQIERVCVQGLDQLTGVDRQQLLHKILSEGDQEADQLPGVDRQQLLPKILSEGVHEADQLVVVEHQQFHRIQQCFSML